MLRRAASVAIVVLLSSGCGSGNAPTTAPATPTSASPAAAAPSAAPASTAPVATLTPTQNALFGVWRRVGDCQAFVDAMRAARLTDLIGTTDGKWMAGGVTPHGTDPTTASYCADAASVVHEHFFRPNLQFGSLDEYGHQVDDGPFELVGADGIQLGAVTVHYRIDAADRLQFTGVSVADPCSGSGSGETASPSGSADCTQDHAWGISAFYPGTYERVP